MSVFINLRHPRDFTSHTSRKRTLYNKVKTCFIRLAWRFRDGLARPISVPVGSAHEKSIGRLPAASSPRRLALWARRAPKVETIESVSRVTPPAPQCIAGYVKPALRIILEKRVRSIPHIFPMKKSLLDDISIHTPHMHLTRESHPSMCNHHAAAEHAG